MLLKTLLGENLELHFLGPVDSCMDLFAPYNVLLNKRIFLHGKVSREMAVRAMQSADILVNIGNTNPFQEPSKIIEYASTGKPIINITSISEDSSALALEKYPAVINVLCQPMGVENNAQITKLVKFIQQPPYVDKDYLKEWVAPYEICAISKIYLTLLNQGSPAQNKQS